MRDKRMYPAYAAGLIDGEGCIRLRKNTSKDLSYVPEIKIGMTDIRPLAFMCRLYKGNLGVEKKVVGQKKVFRWTCSSRKDIKPLLEDIVPFLLVKAPQATLLLEYMHRFKRYGQYPPEQREVYFQALTALNYRGDDTRAAELRSAILKVV